MNTIAAKLGITLLSLLVGGSIITYSLRAGGVIHLRTDPLSAALTAIDPDGTLNRQLVDNEQLAGLSGSVTASAGTMPDATRQEVAPAPAETTTSTHESTRQFIRHKRFSTPGVWLNGKTELPPATITLGPDDGYLLCALDLSSPVSTVHVGDELVLYPASAMEFEYGGQPLYWLNRVEPYSEAKQKTCEQEGPVEKNSWITTSKDGTDTRVKMCYKGDEKAPNTASFLILPNNGFQTGERYMFHVAGSGLAYLLEILP